MDSLCYSSRISIEYYYYDNNLCKLLHNGKRINNNIILHKHVNIITTTIKNITINYYIL